MKLSYSNIIARLGGHAEPVRVPSESDQRLTRLLEGITDAFQVFDADWRIRYMNPAARDFFVGHGLEPDAVMGKHFWDDLFPDAREGEAAQHMRRAMNERVAVSFESYYAPWDVWILSRFDPLPDGGLANHYQDITQRKLAERVLAESRADIAANLEAMTRLQEVSTLLVPTGDSTQLLLEIVDAAIAITAADMGNVQLLDRSSGALKIVASRGFDRPFLEFFDTVHDGEAACGAATRQGGRVLVEDVATSAIFAGTTAREVVLAAGVRAVQSTPLVTRSGQLVGMLSTHYSSPRRPANQDLRIVDLLARQAADWIERTNAEQARRASEERFRRLFELGVIGRAITSPSKGCLEVNDALCHILGYKRAELMRLTWADITHPDDLAADEAHFNRVIAGEIDGYSLDKRFIRKDGTTVATAMWVNCVRRPDRSVDYLVSMVQDISDRVVAEEALRTSEERYRSLISQVRDYAIFSTDQRGVVTSWNEGCQHVLGYGQAEFVGLDSAGLFTPEDQAAGVPAASLHQAVEEGSARADRWMVARGGRRFFAMGTTTTLSDRSGRLIGFSTVMRDLTQLKLSQDELADTGVTLQRLVRERTEELEETTERLRLSERMASLGTLAAGLGHDIGNLLLPLDVRLRLLLEADLPPDLHEHVLGIQKCNQYLQRLSTGLRLLAIEPNRSHSEATELTAWWRDVNMMMGEVIPPNIELVHDLPDSPCWVAIGRIGLTQAVFNLVQNAADALQERSTGRVVVGAVDDPAAGSVRLRVADDGPGMTPEVFQRCRDPYFSTKERGVSTGMGLAFVHGLVTGLGGRVEIDAMLGQGTTVTLVLPAQAPRPASPDSAGRPVRSPTPV